MKNIFNNVYLKDVVGRNHIQNADELDILLDILASSIGANLKYYFTDVGIRNAKLNFRQQEPAHIMENIVYNELLLRGCNVDVGIIDVFDADQKGKRIHKQLEVDFLANRGSQRYYIQVAYDIATEEKQIQELKSLRSISDSLKKIVIVNGSLKPWRNEEGFVIMGMKYFLLNADSLEFRWDFRLWDNMFFAQ